jgi:hypothetical protein
MSSENQEKLDTLDLIITVLREHEKSLDELIRKVSTFSQGPVLPPAARPHGTRGLTLRLDQWRDFTTRSADAETVAYRLDDASLTLTAHAHGVTLVYAEPLPTRTHPVTAPAGLAIPATQRLACGLAVALARVDTVETTGRRAVVAVYRADPALLTAWLAAELARPPSSLVAGVIE